MDFSNYPLSGLTYGGSEKKIGILISGSAYMLKFQKRTDFGLRSNHISEYLGSHVFALLGFPVQETYLGTYQGEQVVACKDFNTPGVQYVPFNEVGESSIDGGAEQYQYDYEDIMRMLRDNSKLTRVEETIRSFWEIYLVDALLGNFDRHGGNWGFLKRSNAYSLAPVFDNGSCLFPSLTDEGEMERIMRSEAETMKRVFTFPTSQIRLDGRKSSYYAVIHSLAYPACNRALAAVYTRTDPWKLDAVVEETPFLTDTQRRFYKHMLSVRYTWILQKPYMMLTKDGI